jgi:hypothetical protein
VYPLLVTCTYLKSKLYLHGKFLPNKVTHVRQAYLPKGIFNPLEQFILGRAPYKVVHSSGVHNLSGQRSQLAVHINHGEHRHLEGLMVYKL